GAAPAGAAVARPGLPGRRPAARAEAPLPGPAELVGRFRDQAVAALEPDWPAEELPALGAACETAARLTLACVVAPPAPVADRTPGRLPAQRTRGELETEAVARLVRDAFARVPAGAPPGERG
ncbi:TetR/AcrR family transcriptional regulator, partial [Streptomyces angustmyceticus]